MNTHKKVSVLFFLMIMATFSLFAQEICDDGIDNDGDGLIDINDTDCSCNGTGNTPSSLIPNPSFEDMVCCPSSFGELNCADTWIQASDATSDYYNTCNYVGDIPLPLPDGEGAAGFISQITTDLFGNDENYFEYLGAALSSPLVNGIEYQLSFDISFNWLDGQGVTANPLPANPTCPIDITIYGTPNAGDLPWTGNECPVGEGGFVELGHVSYSPDATAGWGTITINFTPAFNVAAVVIGGPCSLPTGCGYDSSDPFPYFYADNLVLNESALFTASIDMTGDMCTNDLVLSASSSGTGTYQWYFEGVAISGETNQNLNVSANGGSVGNYQVMYSESGACVIADTLVTLNTVLASVSSDAIICEGENVVVSASGGDSYVWDNGLSAQSNHSITPINSTVYHVTVSNVNGCSDTASVAILVNPIPSVEITGDTILCAGETTQLDAGSGFDTYLWAHSGESVQSVGVSNSGLYTVTVTNSYDCSNSDQINVIVHSNPIPEITGNPIICPGLTTNLDAGGGFSSYLWSNSSNTQSSDYAVGGMAYVTVTDVNSCVGVDSLMLSVNPQIVPVLTASKLFVCIGDEVELSVTGSGAGGSYLWDNGLGAGQIQNPTILGTTEYLVTLTDFNNCQEIGAITITGVDVPVLTVSTDDTLICKGSSLNISVTGAASYTWFPSYGLSSTAGSVVVASPEVTTVYSIIGTNEMGGTECTANIQSNIEVNDLRVTLPIANTVCRNEIVTIFASVTGGGQPYQYTWYANSVLRPETGSSIVDTVKADKNYQVQVVDANDCVLSESVTYSNYPELVMEPYINKDTVCPNDAVLFNASISGGTGSPYQFIFDGHYSSTILTVYPKETYTYSLQVQDGCETINDSITIYTYPIPYLDFVADAYGGCEPKEIKFTSISNPTGLINNYNWNFGDADDNNLSINDSPKHIYNKQGVYDVKLRVLTINGCFVDTTKSKLIHIEPKPSLDFVAEPPYVSILHPEIYFKNKSKDKDSLTYVWDFGTGDLSNIQSPEYMYKNVGNYEVELVGKTAYGCLDTIYKLVEVKPEVVIYIPDAFTPDGDNHNEEFMPKGSNILNSAYVFTIYDRWGESIFETTDLDEGWDGKVKGGDYAKPGIYVYHIIYKDIYGIKYEKEGTVNLIR